MPFPQALITAIEEALIQRQGGLRKNIGGQPHIEFRCPVHSDEHASAHWRCQGSIWKCRACAAGGGIIAICQHLGLDPQAFQQQAEKPARRAGQAPVATYQYAYRGTTYTKARYEYPDQLTDEGKPKKDFVWSPRFPEGVTTSDMPLYWLGEKPAPGSRVLFVEGEKVVEACWQRHLSACCGPWGASQRTFGAGLEELRGYEVWLAADNDEPGRSYMTAIAAELVTRGIARPRWVRVNLPPKGDLWDFFSAGGQPDELWQGDLSEPAVDLVKHDVVTVRQPTPNGIVRFEFAGIHRGGRDSLNAKLSVSFEVAPLSGRSYTSRLNMLSSSARAGLTREIKEVFGFDKAFPWSELMNVACSLAERGWLNAERAVDVFDIEPEQEAEEYLFCDIFPRRQPTVMFGDGSAGKSYLACAFGVALTLGEPFPGCGDRREAGNVVYVDYENVGQEKFRKRISRLYAGYGLDSPAPDTFYYFPSRAQPLHLIADQLAEFVERRNIQYGIIDSAAPACDGPAEASEVALQFFNALATVPMTAAIIAHISKAADGRLNTLKPFGSAMWHNQARRTWYVQSAGDEFSDLKQVAMFCRKVNDGPLAPPKGYLTTYEGRTGPVKYHHTPFTNLDRTLDRMRPPQLRLHDALAQGPLTAGQVASRIGSKTEVVSEWLKKWPNRFVRVNVADATEAHWGLLAHGA